jgi:hypothetical protein
MCCSGEAASKASIVGVDSGVADADGVKMRCSRECPVRDASVSCRIRWRWSSEPSRDCRSSCQIFKSVACASRSRCMARPSSEARCASSSRHPMRILFISSNNFTANVHPVQHVQKRVQKSVLASQRRSSCACTRKNHTSLPRATHQIATPPVTCWDRCFQCPRPRCPPGLLPVVLVHPQPARSSMTNQQTEHASMAVLVHRERERALLLCLCFLPARSPAYL